MDRQGHLRIAHIAKTFQVGGERLQALDGIDLTVPAGALLTIVGASGCGKSTLLRLIAGLEGTDQGELTLDNAPISGTSLDRGLVFQDPRLFPWLTVSQNIGLGLLNARMDKRARQRTVAAHVALVGLDGFQDAYPHQLSGGMAQRAAIARGLVNRPRVLPLGLLLVWACHASPIACSCQASTDCGRLRSWRGSR